MKKVSLIRLLALFGALLTFSAAYSGIPNGSNPTTFLGPMVRGSVTDLYDTGSAFSVAGEAGFQNFRAGATFAWMLAGNQRFKFSGEYLVQKITYPFFVGNTSEWVQQGAIGGDYQYLFVGNPYNPVFDLSAYLSHAPNKGLHTVTGTFMRDGITQNFINTRRIAGSNAGGISPGFTVNPFFGTLVGGQLNYDKVHYDTIYVRSKDAIGLGGTVFLNQAITNSINVDLLAAVRQPFNNYQASINWVNVPKLNHAVVRLTGAYTAGKNTLPSTYDAGITFDYFIDNVSRSPTGMTARAFGQDFLSWTGKPAVYLPQVLAIPDERVTIETQGCPFGVPVFFGVIEDGNTAGGGVTVIRNTAANFTGTNLTFSLQPSKAPAPGNSYSLDPTTGVFTAEGPATDIVTFTVTATNPCGSAISNVFSVTY